MINNTLFDLDALPEKQPDQAVRWQLYFVHPETREKHFLWKNKNPTQHYGDDRYIPESELGRKKPHRLKTYEGAVALASVWNRRVSQDANIVVRVEGVKR